jgi:hypothetical protein
MTGFVVNYTPDCAVTFGLDGRPRKTLDKAYRVGNCQLLLKGRPVPSLVSQVRAHAAG